MNKQISTELLRTKSNQIIVGEVRDEELAKVIPSASSSNSYENMFFTIHTTEPTNLKNRK